VDDLGHPVAFQVLRRGTDVISSDGVVVGAVRQVRWDGRTNIFDGIVVSPKGGGANKFVDAPEVSEILERGVRIAHSSGEIDSLPAPRKHRPLWMRRLGL
jgi:sporulation protein YlmC with PRC-barrel domain